MKALGEYWIALLLAGALGAVLVGAWVRSRQDPGAMSHAAARPARPAAREVPALETLPEDLELREPRAPDAAHGAWAPRAPAASTLAGGEDEGATDGLPPAPRPLPADLASPYGSRYAGLFPDELEAAQKDLRRKQAELAEPIFDERFELGQYRVIGPLKELVPLGASGGMMVSRRPPRLDFIQEQPLATRPLVRMWSESLSDGFTQYRVVEVHPHERPELQALRDEEVWLQARIDELEAEW